MNTSTIFNYNVVQIRVFLMTKLNLLLKSVTRQKENTVFILYYVISRVYIFSDDRL
jgi:hypothetical protein